MENYVGKYLHKSWGYNMTLNTYYKITRQTAKCVYGVMVNSKVVEHGDMNGREVPTDEIDTTYNKNGEYRFNVREEKGFNGIEPAFMGGEYNHSKYNSLWNGKSNYFNHCD